MRDFLRLLLKPGGFFLDPAFRPISLGHRAYSQALSASKNSVPLVIALERHGGCGSIHRTEIFAAGSAFAAATQIYVERLVKFLLWQKGGWKITLGGPKEISGQVQRLYSPNGEKAFDAKLMEAVYEKPFVVEWAGADPIPQARETAVAIGGHLDGCRIGFDLGASDSKFAAVKDGEAIFTTELPWDPAVEANPDFHYRKSTKA